MLKAPIAVLLILLLISAVLVTGDGLAQTQKKARVSGPVDVLVATLMGAWIIWAMVCLYRLCGES